jgi:hypothetical protein
MENRLKSFDLDNEADYTDWRDQKLDGYPTCIEELIVEIKDPQQLTPAEFAALQERCCKTNMVIYAGPTGSDPNKAIPKSLGRRFGLTELESGAVATFPIPTVPSTGTPMAITIYRSARYTGCSCTASRQQPVVVRMHCWIMKSPIYICVTPIRTISMR